NRRTFADRFNLWFNLRFESFLKLYDASVKLVLRRPAITLGLFGGAFVATLWLFPLLGLSFFPRTDSGQFLINLKAPTGTRISVSEGEVAKVEALIRQEVAPEDLNLILSNIGTAPGFSSIYTTN